jgi:DNA helicase-2/ATP-dependent DNA helicase PcrA
MDYQESLAGLNKAQRLAVTTTEGPVLVIAGPGTGKTQLLTTRIAHILATTDTLPQNILCLTFTESGAQTMRERLSNMIGKSAYDVTISTYHAFGSDLIRRFPDYFAEDPNLQPVDDLGIDTIFREIIEKLPFNNPLKYSDAYLGDIKTLVSDAKQALLTPENLRSVAHHNLRYLEAVRPIVAAATTDISRVSKKSVPAFEALAGQLHSVATEPLDSSITPLASLLLKELDEALDEVRIIDKQTPLSTWKKNWLAKDDDALFVIDGQKANEKLLAAADVYEAYLTELKARSLFDYDDMILRAVHALSANNDLRYTLQEQYLYLLLDEFQDTNGAQLEIVKLLTDNPVSEGRPNVLAVGDDDQAIYAFQGANYSHMLQFNEMYRDVTAIPLTQNYRSHADVLHTARGIAEQIEERLHHHFPKIEKTLTAENTKLPKEAVIERREAQSDIMQFAWVAKQIRKLIDSGVPASEIAVLGPQHKYLEPLVPFLNQEHIPVRYDKRENVLDDAAINQLLRMAELCVALQVGNKTLCNALWAEVLSFDFWQLPTSLIWKLSWQATDEDRSWTEELLADEKLQPIALFFIRLSQIAATESLEAMLDYLIGSTPLEYKADDGTDAVFTSPYYTFNFPGLAELGVDSVSDEGWQARGRHPLTRAAAASTGDGANGLTGPQPEKQASIFDVESDETQNASFWELLTNLIVLRARLREYKRGSDEPLHVQDFLEFVQLHRAAELKILNTSPYASGTEAVQLMTAFKSKGMEFTAVFVLAVNDEAWSNRSKGAGNRISLPANLQFIRYAGATNDERLRLFYVAITRAKTQLYLVNYLRSYTGKSMSRLKYLDEHSDDQQQWYSPLLPTSKQLVLPAEETTPMPTTELSAYWQQRHETALDNADLHSLLHSRLERFQLSPTHVNDFTDVIYSGPRAFFMRTILRFPSAPKPEVQFGNAMHETLEWIHKITKQDGLLPSKPAVEKMYEQRLRAKKLTAQSTEQFLERGLVALRAYLAQRGEVIAQDNVVEYNFRNEGVFIGKAHLTGKIDKLIIDRKNKTITIVDYKTGKKSYSHWAREAKLHKYRLQLYMYRALVEGSHTYAGYKVTDAYLEFVEPDEHGKIHELHVLFDDDDYRRVKQLAEVVWEHITTLDLPDTSEYSADLAGIEAFQDDLVDKK